MIVATSLRRVLYIVFFVMGCGKYRIYQAYQIEDTLASDTLTPSP